MSRKNGKLYPGDQNLKSIYDAGMFYTGDVWGPSVSDATWKELQERINKSDYTAYEYFFFIIYFSSKRGGRNNLTLKSYVCHKGWKEFLDFKRTRAYELGRKLKVQRAAFESHKEADYPLSRILLEEFVDIGPVLRIELALEAQDKDGFDPSPVLEKFSDHVWEILLGSPEYLEHLTYLKEELNNDDSDVRASIISE